MMEKSSRLPWFISVFSLGLALIFPLTGRAGSCPSVEPVNAPSSININPGIAIGGVLGTTTLFFPANTVGCNEANSLTGNNLFEMEGAGIPNGKLYPTTIPGIAYRAAFSSSIWTASMSGYWPVSTVAYKSGGAYGQGKVVVEFVKTGPVGDGVFGPQRVGLFSVAGIPIFEVYLATPIIIAPNNPTCTVTQSAITVNLEDTTADQLASVGNTSKDTALNIPLNCTSAANISLAFSGNIADNSNAVFSNLSGSANANTVGVQILKDNTPIPTTAGNYINLGTINGSTSVPLTARYYALANNADAGAVSAIAYATIMYN